VGGKWGHAPWGAGLGGATAHFLQSFKRVFSRNLDQIMLKNAYFSGKHCKNRLSVGAPEPPFASGGWGLRR